MAIRPPDCKCEDWPCCGHGDYDPNAEQEAAEEMALAGGLLEDDTDSEAEDEESDVDESMDGDHESALESVYGPTDPPEYIDDFGNFGDGSGFADD